MTFFENIMKNLRFRTFLRVSILLPGKGCWMSSQTMKKSRRRIKSNKNNLSSFKKFQNMDAQLKQNMIQSFILKKILKSGIELLPKASALLSYHYLFSWDKIRTCSPICVLSPLSSTASNSVKSSETFPSRGSFDRLSAVR